MDPPPFRASHATILKHRTLVQTELDNGITLLFLAYISELHIRNLISSF